jgi:hypothetical protein
MHIPARYCTSYLGDIHIAPELSPMDFVGRFEAHLGDRGYAFDPGNNTPRASRVLIAGEIDAATLHCPAQSNQHAKRLQSLERRSRPNRSARRGAGYVLLVWQQICI